jgi:hypothetical protein
MVDGEGGAEFSPMAEVALEFEANGFESGLDRAVDQAVYGAGSGQCILRIRCAATILRRGLIGGGESWLLDATTRPEFFDFLWRETKNFA